MVQWLHCRAFNPAAFGVVMSWIEYLQQFPPFMLTVIKLCIWLALLSVIFVPLERIWALRRQKVSRKAFWTDLIYYFGNSILPNMALVFPVAVLASVAHRIIPGGWHALVASMPLWARLTAIFVVGEIGFYWGHRMSHEIPFLWRFHAVHHSAEEIDWLVNTRAHPVDIVIGRFCGFVPLYLLGLAQPTRNAADLWPLLLTLAGTIWGFFVHSNLRWRFGPLEWLIATPGFHHWHHTHTDHRDRNYAAMLPWIDRIFGSYYVPKKQWPERYGTDTPVSPNIVLQLVHPFLASGDTNSAQPVRGAKRQPNSIAAEGALD